MFRWWSVLPGCDRVLDQAEELLEQRGGVSGEAGAPALQRALRRETFRGGVAEYFVADLAWHETAESWG